MTREEAIERLENHTQYKCGGEDLVALNMAIQALKQEPIYYPPCQDCHTKVNEIVRAYNNVKSLDDAISRQEAIHCVTETELYNETFAEAKMRIAELKPVLPKHEREDKE